MLGTAVLGLASAAHVKTHDRAAIKALEEKLAAAMAVKHIDRLR